MSSACGRGFNSRRLHQPRNLPGEIRGGFSLSALPFRLMKGFHTFAVLALAASSYTIAKESTVDVTFVGDVMVAETPGEIIERGGDPLADVAKYLGAKRLRIANLECVVATTGTA